MQKYYKELPFTLYLESSLFNICCVYLIILSIFIYLYITHIQFLFFLTLFKSFFPNHFRYICHCSLPFNISMCINKNILWHNHSAVTTFRKLSHHAILLSNPQPVLFLSVILMMTFVCSFSFPTEDAIPSSCAVLGCHEF